MGGNVTGVWVVGAKVNVTSQAVPVNPAGQMQTENGLVSISLHSPPFRHILMAHGDVRIGADVVEKTGMTVSHWFPVKASRHWQTLPSGVTTGLPPL